MPEIDMLPPQEIPEASRSDDVVASHAAHSSTSGGSYVATVPNPWSREKPTFSFGVADEKGARRTMEDAHSFAFDYAGVHGQAFFAIFDGHAGTEAADWCGNHFHEYLLRALTEHPETSVPDIYNQTFHDVDRTLSKIAEDSQGKIHSGCTAVTAFLRLEEADGTQAFVQNLPKASPELQPIQSDSQLPEPDATSTTSTDHDSTNSNGSKKGNSLKKAFRRMTRTEGSPSSTPRSLSPNDTFKNYKPIGPPQTPPPGQTLRRVLYVANAGDARGVLCRGGRAIRLTYDHKGTDKQEAKRIMDSGGFVMSGRVNGVLAVTRSLGDSSMKEFVVGAPYTTETELIDEDEFLILACDGIWDVLDDQQACDIARRIQDPQEACGTLVKEAFQRYTNDNITIMVIRFRDSPADVKAKGSKN
ncbi:protein serine/threonine phosphatase 2C [Dentipellis sp. KUC8613]|nr:protein serine/threonine phosphatase 2C [Dentipellis sp. KUC8613]